MIAVQSMANADYCLLYRNEGSRRKYFNDQERETEPKKKEADPASFQKVQQPLKTGKYDGIALIKDGAVIEHLPEGKPPAAPTASPSAQTTNASSGTAPTAQAGSGAVARFARLRYAQTIGKLFFRSADGTLGIKPLASGDRAVVHIVACASIEQLEQSFRNAQPTDIFVSGVPMSDGLTVVTKAKRGDGDAIARSKDDLPFPEGSGVMFLDNDHPVGTGDDQFDTYVKAVPALAAASYVYAPSSSAWIHDEATGVVLKGAGGQHYAVPVKDATDITRALVALHDRLVLAGYGVPVVREPGGVDIRSPADTAMKTSNQPLFQRASVGPGLIHRKLDHIGSHRGDVFLFDTRLIPNLTPDELRRKSEIERELKATVADDADDARSKWIGKHVVKVAHTNDIPIEQATAILHRALTKDSNNAWDLIPGIQIRFSSSLVDVGELLANPGKYDGKPCADPLEPDYGGGVGVAKFYANAKGKPTIRSHAHGGQIFFLHHDPKDIDFGGILNQGAKKAVREAAKMLELDKHPAPATPGDVSGIMAQAAGSSLPQPNLPMADWIAALQQKKPAATFEFVPAGDLVREPQPVEYLVDELIEHPSLMMLFGAPSAGKSFVAISMAACVATGHPWLGRDVRAGTVFYLAGEGHAGLSRRLRAWEIETGVNLEGAPLFVSKLPAMLMDSENAHTVEQAIKALSDKNGPPVLIVIDTLARNMGSGDESSNADIGTFVAHIDGMRHRLGCTVEIVHHSGHMETERARGASALPAAMDASFQMEDKGGVRSLSQKKAKESELAEPIPLKLKEVPLGWKDAKGREIRSAVIVEADGQEQAAPKSKSLTARQQEGVQSLCKAVVNQDALAAQDGDWLGAHVETWRVEFYRTCTADDKKKAFQRVREDLKARGLVRIEYDICYVRQSEPGLIAQNLTAKMQAAGHGT